MLQYSSLYGSVKRYHAMCYHVCCGPCSPPHDSDLQFCPQGALWSGAGAGQLAGKHRRLPFPCQASDTIDAHLRCRRCRHCRHCAATTTPIIAERRHRKPPLKLIHADLAPLTAKLQPSSHAQVSCSNPSHASNASVRRGLRYPIARTRSHSCGDDPVTSPHGSAGGGASRI